MWAVLALVGVVCAVNLVLQVMLLAEIGKVIRAVEGKPAKKEEPVQALKPGTTWIPSPGEQARKERLFAAEGDRRKWAVGAPKSGFRSGLPPSSRS